MRNDHETVIKVYYNGGRGAANVSVMVGGVTKTTDSNGEAKFTHTCAPRTVDIYVNKGEKHERKSSSGSYTYHIAKRR